MDGQVERIRIAEEDSAPMESVGSVEARPGGLVGDRYYEGTGYYSPFDVCEVTFVAAEALERIHEEFGIDLSDGRHRRNVVTRGVDLHDLLDHRFAVGEVSFEGTRPRPPCAHVEEVADEDGVMEALTEGRGGICADIVEGGELRVGDEFGARETVNPDPASIARAMRERADERTERRIE
ncbi:MOSC domain-containing protein [Haloglomus litoreum]|uniref:MOSC domain-containing protein n=1 Tax=Haloglomus litoreum TaxID=3034026 RepID=UPI0023E8A80F|nr:MOSC domain-containing protein [Haloglomus sp. DT116]